MPIDGEKVNGETNVLERRRLVIDLGGGIGRMSRVAKKTTKGGWLAIESRRTPSCTTIVPQMSEASR